MKHLAFFLLCLSNLAFAQTDLVLTFVESNETVEFLYNDCLNGISINATNILDSLYFPVVTVSNGTIKPSEKDLYGLCDCIKNKKICQFFPFFS